MPARQRPPSAARDLIPDRPDLERLRATAAGCTACDLYRDATQTVFGEGAPTSEVMLVGEQSGDGEDRSEEHTSELQSPDHLVCRLLLEKKKKRHIPVTLSILSNTHKS